MANATRKPMRQGQQNRRGRGRGRNKSQNPLSRNYESNGPDVKIRGTAAHIAEKYASLARDALSSGDNVAGESYLQHAEHYNRIIMASQPQQPEGLNGSGAERSQPESSSEEADAKQPEAKQDAKQPEAKQPEAKQDAKKVEKAAKASTGNSGSEPNSDDGLLRTLSRTTKSNGKSAAESDDDSPASDEAVEAEEAPKKGGGKESSDDGKEAPDEAVT